MINLIYKRRIINEIASDILDIAQVEAGDLRNMVYGDIVEYLISRIKDLEIIEE